MRPKLTTAWFNETKLPSDITPLTEDSRVAVADATAVTVAVPGMDTLVWITASARVLVEICVEVDEGEDEDKVDNGDSDEE